MFSSAGKLDRLHIMGPGNEIVEMFSQRMFLHQNQEILRDIGALKAACEADTVAEDEAGTVLLDGAAGLRHCCLGGSGGRHQRL